MYPRLSPKTTPSGQSPPFRAKFWHRMKMPLTGGNPQGPGGLSVTVSPFLRIPKKVASRRSPSRPPPPPLFSFGVTESGLLLSRNCPLTFNHARLYRPPTPMGEHFGHYQAYRNADGSLPGPLMLGKSSAPQPFLSPPLKEDLK